MKGKTLGCLTPFGLASAAAVLVLVGLIVAFMGGKIFSPGPLNGRTGAEVGGVVSHAELGGNCAACHPAPWSADTLTGRCTGCHQNVLAEIARPDQLHGILLAGEPAQACRECHTEHHGPAASLTKTTLMDFPHEKLGFSLAAHTTSLSSIQALVCSDCHLSYSSASLGAQPGPDGVFDVKICADCHTTVDRIFMKEHTAAYGPAAGGSCLGCHDGVETYGKAFDHQVVSFKLVGKHQPVTCAKCHSGEKTLVEMKATPTGCYACHHGDDTHKGGFGQDCAQCHTAEGWDQATFDHSLASFPLTGAHVQVACEKCHVNGVFKGTPSTCFACHQKDDPHKGSFGQDCGACHVPTDWKQATFDHSKASFPLTGAHVRVACEKCHVNRVFKGTASTCLSCHADPAFHRGVLGTDCKACHTTSAWSPATFNGPHTFPLNHGKADSCRQCHPATVTAFDCYSCHPQAQMKSKHQEERINDITNCVRCHPSGRGGD
jgi:hypothetical protein